MCDIVYIYSQVIIIQVSYMAGEIACSGKCKHMNETYVALFSALTWVDTASHISLE